MASRDDSQKEYAPGVTLVGDNNCMHGTSYSGEAPALISCGLVKPEWLPGVTGNGKTAQLVVFLDDGTAKLLPAKSRFVSCDLGFGGVSIKTSGRRYRVFRYWTIEEKAKKAAEKQEAEARQTWLAAKTVTAQPDYPSRWKEGVLYHVLQAEKLIDGRLYFEEFPDVGLASSDVESAKRIFAELKSLLSLATPTIKQKVVARSNVFSLNDAAFRNMNRH